MTGRRRWGEQPRPAGRPPLDPRVRARILGLHAEDPSLSTRKIAAMVGCSRETVRVIVKSASGSPVDGLVTAGLGPADRRSVAWAVAASRAMSEADHAAFDAYRGAIYESPGVWWTFP